MTLKAYTIEEVIGEVGVAALPGEKLTVDVGDTVRVHLTVDYMGPAIDGSVWVAIGRQNLGFAEDFVPDAPVPVHFNESVPWVTYPIVVDIPIWDRPGTDYDMYAKIMQVPGPDIFTPVLLNIIDVIATVPTPPVYELVYQHEYPRGKTYVGHAEECTATFTVPLPEQLFPNSWVIEEIALTFADEVAKEGGEMLDIKIYEDATPLWHTDYKIVATAIASPLPWAVIIPLILVITLVVAFITLIVEFKEIDWGEVPAPIPWAILAVAGGLGVLGVGAALALGAPKPKG